MSEVKIMPCLIMPENMLFFREIYCVGKKFTLPALTNFTSGFDFMTNKPLSVAAEFNPWPLITSLCPGRWKKLPSSWRPNAAPFKASAHNLPTDYRTSKWKTSWVIVTLSPKYSPSISSSLPSRIDALCTCHEPLWRKKQNWHMLKNLHI